MTEEKSIQQYGCTIYSLNGFPYDPNQNGCYSKEQLAKLPTALDALGGRCYVLSVNSLQKKAKKILEEHGFKVLARTYTAHINGLDSEIKVWEKSGRSNKDTVYLMGKGFYKKPRVKN